MSQRRRQTTCRLHHVTTRGNDRQPIFVDADDREHFYTLLDTAISANDVECHQDVQMGNHVHLLLAGEIEAVSAVMWFVSYRYALAFNARHGRANHLLGRRFHSADVPDRTAARAVCVYIAMNPVRGGLCRHPRDWAYGSYASSVGSSTPRPHLSRHFTDALFAGRTTTFEEATEAALALDRGGRPPLGALLPTPDRLTHEHVRHARQVYGYTVREIAAHYRRTPRTLLRWLAV